MIRVEVAYALPERQALITLDVEENCTVLAAVQRSGIERDFPEINWSTAHFGIFSIPVEKPAEQMLRAGDRIEIYRPLLIDPKAVRKARADQSRLPGNTKTRRAKDINN